MGFSEFSDFSGLDLDLVLEAGESSGSAVDSAPAVVIFDAGASEVWGASPGMTGRDLREEATGRLAAMASLVRASSVETRTTAFFSALAVRAISLTLTELKNTVGFLGGTSATIFLSEALSLDKISVISSLGSI